MRPETKQLLKNISIGLGVFLGIGLVLYGMWHGTRVESLTITTVEVTGGETISHATVAADIQTVLEGEYLGFVPRRFAWTYPKQEVLAKLSEVERAKDPIIVRDGTTLFIALAEYEPVALWCNTSGSDTCVFLDSEGFGFAAAPTLRGGAYTRYVFIGEPAEVSQFYATTIDFTFLRELVALLDQAGWPVLSVEFDQARDAFIYLANGGELKTTLLQTPTETVDNLLTILAAEQYQHLQPGNFEYIDLRFGNKVFVNEFGDPAELVTETATSSNDVAAE